MPRRRWRDGGAALALLVLTAAGPTPGGPTPQRQAELRHLLLHDCGSCHGMTMKGGLGRPLLPEAIAGQSDELLADIILNGIRGTAMPPWAGELTPEEAAWMVQLLRKGVSP